MAAGKRPVPFRTRLAKPARADGTAPGRVWESRLPPAYNFIFLCVVGSIIPVVGVVVPTTLFFVHPHNKQTGMYLERLASRTPPRLAQNSGEAVDLVIVRYTRTMDVLESEPQC